MEYDFGYTRNERAPRNGYAGNFRFVDEDASKKRRVRAKEKSGPKTKTDYLIRLILLQTALCALFVAGVFIVSRASPAAYARMKEDYGKIMRENMSAGDFAERLKEAAEFVFKPVRPTLPAASGAAERETADAAPRPEPEENIETGEEREPSTFEAMSDETGEIVAIGEITGAGGEDMEKREAAKGASFAPYYVSVPPVPPVKNARITSRFGYRTNPISGDYGFHTGLDLAVPEGTPVAAAYYGRVEKTGESDVWGKYVLMKHSENFGTFYCHLSTIYADEGAIIRRGETIGLAGSTGWSTGPHLHFEVRINGIRVNPEPLLYPENCDED